jgi:hypothetical protein
MTNTDWLDKMVERSPAARVLAYVGELHFAGAKEDDKIGRTVKFDLRVLPEDAGKANPFGAFTRRRAGHAGSRFVMSMSGIDNAREFADEVMLLNWSDGPKGQTVTFMISPQHDRHPFMGVTRGAQFMATLVEINDDEQAVDQVKRERLERAPQKLSNAAAQVVKNPQYWEFLNVKDAEEADFAMKLSLGIESKRELDSNPEAVKEFRDHMDEFVQWQKFKGYL